jgi:hypothetical protein
MNISSSMVRTAAIGTGVTGGIVMLGNALLPKEGQDSQVLSAKTGKEATLFGAVAAIALEHKAAPFAGGMVAGVIAGDIGSTLIGSPHVNAYGAPEADAADAKPQPQPQPQVQVRYVPVPYLPPPAFARPAPMYAAPIPAGPIYQ